MLDVFISSLSLPLLHAAVLTDFLTPTQMDKSRGGREKYYDSLWISNKLLVPKKLEILLSRSVLLLLCVGTELLLFAEEREREREKEREREHQKREGEKRRNYCARDILCARKAPVKKGSSSSSSSSTTTSHRVL